MLWIVLAVLLSHSLVAARAAISLTLFDDDNVYLQIYGFNAPKDEWLMIKCVDLKVLLETRLHTSQYRDTILLRADLGRFGIKTDKSVECSVMLSDEKTIIPLHLRRLRGTPHRNSLPETISFSPVTEISQDSPHYSFSHEPLAEIEAYEKMYEEHEFLPLDSGLRKANLALKQQTGSKIYLTLTTSPSRLKLLHYTLRSMNLDLVDVIFVVLPRRFKDKQEYVIPSELLLEFPKIKLLSEERDFGPVSKLVSSVQFVYETDGRDEADKAIFISIDDDNMYSDRLIDTLAYHSFVNEHSVITAASFGFFSFASFGMHTPTIIPYSGDHLTVVSDVEGFAGVAYRGRHVDYELMKFLADKHTNPNLKACYFSDDMVISNVLQLRNIPILRLPREKGVHFYSRNERRDLPHFRDENSLHLMNEDGVNEKRYTHINKYQLCQMELLSYFVDFEQKNMPFIDVPLYK